MKRPRCAVVFELARVPATLANSVSSLPRPTLRPGWNRRPRWRTRIEPPVTMLPS